MNCDNCKIEIIDNPYEIKEGKVILYTLCQDCKATFQALCLWCVSMIFEDSVYNVKCFWNRTLEGHPICEKCLGSFKYGKQTTENEDRIRLGLKPEVPIGQKKRGIEKWI